MHCFTTTFRIMIWSPILFTSIISFFHSSSTIMFTPFVDLTYNTKNVLLHYKFYSYDMISYPIYIHDILLWFCINNNAYIKLSNSFTLSSTHLIYIRYIQLIFLLVILTTFSMYFYIRVPIFHDPKRILLSCTNFFIQSRVQRYENPCLFFNVI